MEKLVSLIKTNGWNSETKQLVREKLVNCPTGRFSFYDVHKCFHKEVTAEHVISVLQEVRLWEKSAPKSRYANDEELAEVYGNVVGNTECHRTFNDPDELIEFWNGTSLTKARAFLATGNGYTKLECPAYGLEDGIPFFTQYGLQVMLSDFRARDYARRQAYVLDDIPAIIHGWIKARYLFPANNHNEYGIPCEYHKYIEKGEIIKTYK